MNSTPIAYQSGHAGPLIHVECWSDHDAKTRARTGQMAYLGTLVYPGHPLLKTARCGFCGKPILPLKTSPTPKNLTTATQRSIPTPDLTCTAQNPAFTGLWLHPPRVKHPGMAPGDLSGLNQVMQ